MALIFISLWLMILSTYVTVGHVYIFLGKVSIQVLYPFLNFFFFFFCYWVVFVLYVFWILTPYQIYDLQIFFHWQECLLILLIVPFAVQKLFSLMKSHLFILDFVICVLWIKAKKLLPRHMSGRFFPLLSSRSYMVSGLMFKSLIHFKLIFVSSVKEGFNFVLS